GRVTARAGALTGLAPGTPVVGGGADNACGAAGVGAISPGEAVSSWGTSGTVLAPTAEPRVDPGLRAHTFCHVAPGVWYVTRAVLEGVCFAMRDCVAILQELDMTPKHLLLTGGGAKSAFIRRLQADVFGLPVTTVNREEGPAYGAALLAAVGVGAFPDLKAAVQCTLERAPLMDADPAAHRDYQRIYERFRGCYTAAVSPRS